MGGVWSGAAETLVRVLDDSAVFSNTPRCGTARHVAARPLCSLYIQVFGMRGCIHVTLVLFPAADRRCLLHLRPAEPFRPDCTFIIHRERCKRRLYPRSEILL